MLQKVLSSIAISVALGATACAVGPGGQPAEPPAFGSNDYAWPPKTLDGSHPGWQAPPLAKQAPAGGAASQTAPSGPAFVAGPPLEHVGSTGEGCTESLGALGIEFDQVDSVRGVDTPVVVTSPIGQIRYYANGNLPLLLDCRMAVTLANIAPLLREHGVSEVRFSGAYVYRMSSKGRLSLHARGLALDVHELTVRGQKLSVESHFKKGLGRECAANFPVLNQIACSLRSTGVFQELLTPDYDADHHDHFHIAIAPITPDA